MVRVKAPSRGLVTRLPSELADKFKPNDLNRTCVVAQNVRFEDGVAAAAPGFERIQFTGGLFTTLLHHWKLDEASEDRIDSHGSNDLSDFGAFPTSSTAGKFGNAANFADLVATDSALRTASAFALSNGSDCTITGWLNFMGGTGVLHVFGVSGTFDLAIENQKLAFYAYNTIAGSTRVESATLTPSTNYFFAAKIQSGSQISIRINAVAAVTGSFTGTSTFPGRPVAGGASGSSGSGGFWLDSVSVFSSALSTGNIDLLYASGAGLDYPFLGGPIYTIHQADYLQSPDNPLFLCNPNHLYLATRSYSSSPRTFSVALTDLYSAPSATTAELRWHVCDFYNRVVFAADGIAPQQYLTGSTTSALPGLPTGEDYAGVTAFAGHVLFWRDVTLKWSDLNDATNYIPVAETVSTNSVGVATGGFTQPALGATTSVFYVDEAPTGWVVGMYVRIEHSVSSVSYYLVASISPFLQLSAISVASSQTATGSATTTIFIKEAVEWAVGTLVVAGASTNVLTVAGAAEESTNSWIVSADATVVAGSPRTVTGLILTSQATDLAINDYISIGPNTIPGRDVYQITAISTDATTGQVKLNLNQVGTGTGSSPLGDAATIVDGAVVVRQPWVSLTNAGSNVTISASTTISEKYGLTLTLQNLTGAQSGGTVSAGAVLAPLQANEAGEAQLIGADDNGDILEVVPVGEYAVALKSRSVSSVQYVGRQQGTFFKRTELRSDGLLARNAWAKLGDSRIAFLGRKELYIYSGGQNAEPICQQYTRQLYSELDRARLGEAFAFHNELRNELWLAYPSIGGGQRVLVYNYLEDSATIDDYETASLALTTAGQADWSTDPDWASMVGSWSDLGDDITWASLTASGEQLLTLIAQENGNVAVHGEVWNRDGDGYDCIAETCDFDLGDSELWKYVDCIRIIFDPITDSVPRTVFVQIGMRSDSLSPVTYTLAEAIDISSTTTQPVNVNPGGAGRFIRLKVYSTDPDVKWRISGFEIITRAGSTY